MNKLNSEQVNFLNNNNINLIITIEISKTEFVITPLLKSLKKLDKLSDKITYLLVFDEDSIKKHIDISKLIMDKMNTNKIIIDIVYDNDSDKVKRNRDLHILAKTSIAQFSWKKRYSECMYGVITINTNGDILACPRLSSYPIGNVSDFRRAVKKSNTESFWYLNKDKITPCNQCMKRYVCPDCRYIENKLSNKLDVTITCPRGK